MVNRKSFSDEQFDLAKSMLRSSENHFIRFERSTQGNPVVVFRCPNRTENSINLNKVTSGYLCTCSKCLDNPSDELKASLLHKAENHKTKCNHFGFEYIRTDFRSSGNTSIVANCPHGKKHTFNLSVISSKKLTCSCNKEVSNSTFEDLSTKNDSAPIPPKKLCKSCLSENCVCSVIRQIATTSDLTKCQYVVGYNAIFAEITFANLRTIGMDRYFARLAKSSNLNPLVMLRLVNWRRIAKINSKQKEPGYNIDHIIPLSHFDLNNPLHVYWANDLRNLRFVPEDQNAKKGSKLTKEDLLLIQQSKYLTAVMQKIKM
ncbi:MAG: hypothetical protein ACRCXZ_08670 [Patescibacteria group bacterium]